MSKKKKKEKKEKQGATVKVRRVREREREREKAGRRRERRVEWLIAIFNLRKKYHSKYCCMPSYVLYSRCRAAVSLTPYDGHYDAVKRNDARNRRVADLAAAPAPVDHALSVLRSTFYNGIVISDR